MSYEVITFPTPAPPLAEELEASIDVAQRAGTISEPDPGECLDCYVNRVLAQFGCVGDLRFTRAWIAKQHKKDWVLDWARKRGGYCDCEVVMNALGRVPSGAKYSGLRCTLSFQAELAGW